jgi:hypothetical protein
MTDPIKERIISELLTSATQVSTLASAIRKQTSNAVEKNLLPDNFVISLQFSVLNEAVRTMNFAHRQLIDYAA